MEIEREPSGAPKMLTPSKVFILFGASHVGPMGGKSWGYSPGVSGVGAWNGEPP